MDTAQSSCLCTPLPTPLQPSSPLPAPKEEPLTLHSLPRGLRFIYRPANCPLPSVLVACRGRRAGTHTGPPTPWGSASATSSRKRFCAEAAQEGQVQSELLFCPGVQGQRPLLPAQ